jgi:retron-type reverse transcriptase
MENLKCALYFASRGKKNRKSVLRTMTDSESKLKFLQNLLINEEYHPLSYNRKTIIDRCTCKVREIFVPRFYPDQIVQWALMLVIKPILLKGMYDFSCASIDGRGGLYGVNAVKKWLRTDKKCTKYCLVIDIKKFYPSVNQEILLEKFKRKIKDTQTLSLIEKIVHSVPSGLPIGNFTSQWFANFYLQDFDHYVKEQLKIKHYIRYMDDMVFFSSNKRTLSRQRTLIDQYLQNEKLTVKPNWQIFKVGESKNNGRPIDFLGYKFYRNYTTMRARTFLRTTRRIRKISKKSYLTAKDSCAVMSYVARMNVTSGDKFYNKYVRPYINLKACRLTISIHDSKKAKAEKERMGMVIGV